MEFLKKIWQFIVAFITAPTRPVALAHVRLTSVDVRLIHCLSASTPDVYFGHVRPKFHIGVISSEYPKKCMIPERSAQFVNGYDIKNPALPDFVRLRGFENTRFYPFKEFAKALGYDVLWCVFKEPGSKNYTGHVLFAKHVSKAVWIHISEGFVQKYLGSVYRDELYTDGWAYAQLCEHSGKYCYIVQMVGNSICVPCEHVSEIADPE